MDKLEKRKLPLIAVIVSTSLHNCCEFLRFNKLNPECFKMVCSIEKLKGISTDTPIIFTHSPDNHYEPYFELRKFATTRFKSVRFIDY
ncbi:hypothetical protein EV210_101192 [Anaerospora hongkongensis]|uniref:Uncharacterized protein n=1 Tax=Anaerospora hongkongensis TaxID=244830 RepID=A0A4R1Q4P9_9FIRM|nr:hypothetical protein EV210_101192 [Anaerospora hongkongensis]